MSKKKKRIKKLSKRIKRLEKSHYEPSDHLSEVCNLNGQIFDLIIERLP